MLRAVTLDYWDTLYDATTLDVRVDKRSAAMRELVRALGRELPDDEWDTLYRASGAEAERWWREEARGYVAADRVRWALERLELACAPDDPRLGEVVRAVDEALLEHAPPLLPGAADAVRAFADMGLALAIVSDTGFASGTAQTAILARDGLASAFGATIYSCDVGHAKPHPVPFRLALEALGVAPDEVLHIGDIERTDVAGALGAGLRAIRLDVMRDSGPTAAELAAPTWAAAVARVREHVQERTASR